MTSVTSIGFACLALAAGMALYYRVDYLRRYLIQPALIAGLLLLLLGSQGLSLIGSANYQAWSGWPGFLISFLFSTLILAAPESRESTETKAFIVVDKKSSSDLREQVPNSELALAGR